MKTKIESLRARVRKIRVTPDMAPTYLAMSLHDIADALEEVDGRLEALESAEKAKKQRKEWAVGAKVPG